MKLYLGNNTKQHLVLHYRTFDGREVKAVTIPPGGQRMFPGDITSGDVDRLVEQWKHFGLVEDSIDHDRVDRGAIAAITYRVDRSVEREALENAIEHNDESAVERSRKVFAESGVALDAAVGDQAEQEGNALRETEVTVQEDYDGVRPKSLVVDGVIMSRKGEGREFMRGRAARA